MTHVQLPSQAKIDSFDDQLLDLGVDLFSAWLAETEIENANTAKTVNSRFFTGIPLGWIPVVLKTCQGVYFNSHVVHRKPV